MPCPTIVTLSSIPPRFHLLGPALDSLLGQDLPAQAIHLHIPERYRRFPDWDGTLPQVPKGVTIRRCPQDLGPATKILPATREFAGQDVDLLFCDDDRIYDPRWHGRFKRNRLAHPETCLVEAGENLPDIANDSRPQDRKPRAKRWVRKPLSCRIQRVISLFSIKSAMHANSGYVDVLSGHGGVMARSHWFDAEVWEIPEILWTVDDPWLSGHLERKGIPIWLIAEVCRISATDAGGIDALHDLVHQDHDRIKADIAAIDYMRKTYGIWKPAGKVTPPAGHMSETMRELSRRAFQAS